MYYKKTSVDNNENDQVDTQEDIENKSDEELQQKNQDEHLKHGKAKSRAKFQVIITIYSMVLVAIWFIIYANYKRKIGKREVKRIIIALVLIFYL